MKTIKILLQIKWYKNDSGGDRRTIAIDYENLLDLKEKTNKVLHNFRTLPMDIDYINDGRNIGKIPFSVNLLY